MGRTDRSAAPGGTAMLVLALLKSGEMYGYQIIEELERRSEQVFRLKEGTLYPLLHSLEKEGFVKARDAEAPNGRQRRYYRITRAGLQSLEEKEREWQTYAGAVHAVLAGGTP